jgi:tetratricopeptide (TPR) repeat protein
MNAPPANALQDAPQISRERLSRLAALIIILAGLAAYANSLSNAFVFDDMDSIVSNGAIQHLWPPWKFFAPLNRPILNLSLAVNYALSGGGVISYHAFNIAVHILAALTLFGLVRRTLLQYGSLEESACALALATALIWEVHPLQTESVTYIIQRAESLAGLFYLLTLYGLVRASADAATSDAETGGRGDAENKRKPFLRASPSPRLSVFLWRAVAVVACALGMGTKQTVATAPLVALLYDRVFLSGSFREALRRRWAVYAALAATWLLVVPSLLSPSGAQHVSAGFQMTSISPMEYAVTQLGVILHYLRLSFWPAGLCLDYHWPQAKGLADILPGAVVVGALAAATAAALALRPKFFGFLGAWFFLILAPTSSFMPIADAAVEHRMYLPLAAIAAFVVIGGWVLLGRLVRRGGFGGDRRSVRTWPAVVLFLIVAVLGYLTTLRNLDYRSAFSIWDDTVRKAPDNPRARNGRGEAYFHMKKYEEALRDYDDAAALNRNYAPAYNSRAILYNEQGKYDEALENADAAIALDPEFAVYHNTRAVVLAHRHDYPAAIREYDQAVRFDPYFADAYMNRGVDYGKIGRLAEALADFDKAIALRSDYPSAYYNRGNTYADRKDYDQAIRDYTRAIELRPDYREACYNRAVAWFEKKEYRRAWADIRALRSLGAEPPPEFLHALTQAAPPD